MHTGVWNGDILLAVNIAERGALRRRQDRRPAAHSGKADIGATGAPGRSEDRGLMLQRARGSPTGGQRPGNPLSLAASQCSMLPHCRDAFPVGIEQPRPIRIFGSGVRSIDGGAHRNGVSFEPRYGLHQSVSDLFGRIFTDMNNRLISHWSFPFEERCGRGVIA
jgi:hypothetical protein